MLDGDSTDDDVVIIGYSRGGIVSNRRRGPLRVSRWDHQVRRSSRRASIRSIYRNSGSYSRTNSNGERAVSDADLLLLKLKIRALRNFCSMYRRNSHHPLRTTGRNHSVRRERVTTERATTVGSNSSPPIIVIDDDDTSRPPPPVIVIDDDTVETDEVIILGTKPSTCGPRCRIQITDAERHDTSLVFWNMSESFVKLVERTALKWHCSPGDVVLLVSGKRVSETSTPSSLSFNTNYFNCMTVRKIQSARLPRQITVSFVISGRNPITMTVGEDIPFVMICNMLVSRHGLNEKLSFFFNKKEITFEKTPKMVGIKDGDIIEVQSQ